MVELGKVAAVERNGVEPAALPPETPYLGLEHIERGGRIIGHGTVAGAELASTKFRFAAEHVLFGKLRPNLGKVSRPDFEGVCSTDILPIRPGADLDRDYLAHYLAQPSMVAFAASRTSGANLPRLSPAVLATFPIPLPSLFEQRRIAAILDHADALRAKRRQVLAHLDSLTQSIFHDMFGDADGAVVRLSEIADAASGITKGRRTSEATEPAPYLAVANVQAGYLRMENVKTIEATKAEIERYALRHGDLVLTEGGDPDKLGRGTVWRSELPLCLHQNHVFRVRIHGSGHVLPEYLAAFMADRSARSYFLRSAKQTTGIASINMTQLRNLPVLLPAVAEQGVFTERAACVAKQRAAVQGMIAADNALFASVRSRAFRSES